MVGRLLRQKVPASDRFPDEFLGVFQHQKNKQSPAFYIFFFFEKQTMKTCFVLALLAVTCTFAMKATSEGESMFNEFVSRYSKVYHSEAERRKRFANFEATLKRAAAKIQRNPEAEYGINFFSDFTPEEFKTYHSLKRDKGALRDRELRTDPQFQVSGSFPQTFDWRKKGAVSYVKNQQQCGSCWAFSTTGVIESSWFLAGHNLTTVSEQEIVSCDPNDDGCDGGDPRSAMKWLIDSEGGWITSETDYPYTSGGGNSGTCRLPKPKVVQINGYYDVERNEQVMAEYLSTMGPLSICVDASSWQDYNGGVLNDCGDNVDHCVLLVGYNLVASPPYWIVKNSWGASWGLDGYLYVQYGSNQCDINSEATKALVAGGPTPPPGPPTPAPASSSSEGPPAPSSSSGFPPAPSSSSGFPPAPSSSSGFPPAPSSSSGFAPPAPSGSSSSFEE